MGNKTSRRSKSESSGGDKNVVDGRHLNTSTSAVETRTTGSSSRENRKKIISCPDLSHGATPYQFEADHAAEQKQLDVKIYRSYSNITEASKRAEPRPDIRVYRRNAATNGGRRGNGRYGDMNTDHSQTLPRGFGRSRSTVANGTSGNGLVTGGELMATLPPRGRSMSSQNDVKRYSTLGISSSSSFSEMKARRSNSTTSIGYRVNVDDFPDTSTIKRRLAQFETCFTRSLTQQFTCLSSSTQLNLLSIALRPDRANQHISLHQYLTSPDIPVDLLSDSATDDFCLTIQPALFSGVMHTRRKWSGDSELVLSLVAELVTCLTAEAASELGRIFEYQLSLLREGLCIELVASHAAHCVMEFISRTGKMLDRNSIVHGVIKGHYQPTTRITPKISVIIGQRELKWELHEIFKKPGLRKEFFLFSADVQLHDDQPPWHFLTSYRHDAMLYGYRGLVIDWDYTIDSTSTARHVGTTPAVCGYRLNGEDEVSFPEEMDWRPDDFHRTYCPYRRLVGSNVVNEFTRVSSGRGTRLETSTGHQQQRSASLEEYVNRLQGEKYSRDTIQVIYRPIGDSSTILLAGVTIDHDDIFTMSPRRDNSHYSNSCYSNRVTADDQTVIDKQCRPTTCVVVTLAPPTTSSMTSFPLAVEQHDNLTCQPNGSTTMLQYDVTDRTLPVSDVMHDDVTCDSVSDTPCEDYDNNISGFIPVIHESNRRTIRSDL